MDLYVIAPGSPASVVAAPGTPNTAPTKKGTIKAEEVEGRHSDPTGKKAVRWDEHLTKVKSK